MGLVYVAEHTLIGKKVAVKTVRPELIQHAGVAERFINEARAVNTVGDEHLVDIFDAGQTADGVVYCVMELLVGESLHDFKKRLGKVDLELAVPIVLQIARALHACHAKNIIHRDLKPANIFIVRRGGESFVKILDFGIAKLIGQSSAATNSNAIIGTPFYMAPEQCRGSKDLDHRIDVYSLGVILYELCTGTLPFEGDSAGDVIIKHATEPVEDPRVRVHELPEWMARIILRALEKNRDARFPDMEAFARALEDKNPGVAATPSRPPPPMSGPSRYLESAGMLSGAPTQSLAVDPSSDAFRVIERSSATFTPAVAPKTPAVVDTARRRPSRPAAPADIERSAASRVWLAVAAAVLLVVVGIAGFYAAGKPTNDAKPTESGASASQPPGLVERAKETAPASEAPRVEPTAGTFNLPSTPVATPAPLAPPPSTQVVVTPARPPATAKRGQKTVASPAVPSASPKVVPARPRNENDQLLPPKDSLLPPE
jgi:serine/threonine-protein kinase